MEMKYVVVQSSEEGQQMFIFPKNIDHDRFTEVLSFIKTGSSENWKRLLRRVVSAGFTDGKTCYGNSESLGLRADPRDTELLLNNGHKNAGRIPIK